VFLDFLSRRWVRPFGLRDNEGLLLVDPRTFKRNFAAIHDMKVKDEINLLAKEYGKLKEPWAFVAR
jgi:hypothetical protein